MHLYLKKGSLEFTNPGSPTLAVIAEKREPEGRPPVPRVLHTACFFNNRYLAIYGGKNESVYKYIHNLGLNDICLYDVENNRWEALAMFGSVPSSRWAHTMCAHDSKLIVFGGINLKSYCSGNAKVFDVGRQRASTNLTHHLRFQTTTRGSRSTCGASRASCTSWRTGDAS